MPKGSRYVDVSRAALVQALEAAGFKQHPSDLACLAEALLQGVSIVEPVQP